MHNAYQQAACLGKQAFTDKRTAEKVAQAMRRRRDSKANVFKCTCCGEFHIGTPSTFKR